MPFMQAPSSGGEYRTFLKYDARAGRFFTKPDGGGDQYEVSNMTAIMDLANIRTGWFTFMEGAAPSKTFDPSLSEAAPRPSPDAKRGFEVLMFSNKNIGGVREMTSTAGVVIDAMNSLYDAWEAAPESKAGKVPIVKCEGTTAVKSAKSTNYAPIFKIVKWADRPSELPANEPVASAPPPAAKGHVPPPAAKTHEAPPLDDDVDF